VPLKPNNIILFVCIGLLGIGACKKGAPLENEAPETHLPVGAINLTGQARLNSLVKLEWWGTDPDGYITGFEFSFDENVWHFTESQDSTFLFTITEGSDTIDIDFWVRAVDNSKVVDASPAYLSIPLKNTPPEVSFVDELMPSDTAFNLLTLAWDAVDLDGFESIKEIQIKVNEGDWITFSPRSADGETEFATLVPENPKATGPASASLFSESGDVLGTSTSLRLNGLNSIYIRNVDLAGSVSIEDTLDNIYFNGQTEDLLVLGTSSALPNAFYKSQLDGIGVSFDFIDYVLEDRKNMPRVWNPSMSILLSQYDKVLIYAAEDVVVNAQTKQEDIFLEFAASAIDGYINNGGKVWIVSSMPNGHSPNSALFGILPVDSLSSSPPPSQARLPIDSLAVGAFGYPDLTSNALITIDPFYASSDAEIIYAAQLTKNLGWYGPEDNCIGVRRKVSGNTAMVFISVDLHRINKDEPAVAALFEKILKSEFNW
jgi:hypothetical protein